MRNSIVNVAAYALCAIVAASMLSHGASAQDKIRRGEYLTTIMDCGGCHTPGALAGKPDGTRNLAGPWIGFQIPDLGMISTK
jgi:mono/diheme cytochrome c family protein